MTDQDRRRDWMLFSLTIFALGSFLAFCASWYNTDKSFRVQMAKIEEQKRAIEANKIAVDANTERMEKESIADRQVIAKFFGFLNESQKHDRIVLEDLLKSRDLFQATQVRLLKNQELIIESLKTQKPEQIMIRKGKQWTSQ